jgi:hypothetical protein
MFLLGNNAHRLSRKPCSLVTTKKAPLVTNVLLIIFKIWSSVSMDVGW